MDVIILVMEVLAPAGGLLSCYSYSAVVATMVLALVVMVVVMDVVVDLAAMAAHGLSSLLFSSAAAVTMVPAANSKSDNM